MTQIEKEALVLFRDYTHLQLKMFMISEVKRKENMVGGATEDYDSLVLNKALEYHSYYLSIKLNENGSKKEGRNKA